MTGGWGIFPSRLPPNAYLFLRRVSPLVFLLGAAWGALFPFVAYKIWPMNGPAKEPGWDLVALVIGASIWLVSQALLTRPPFEVLASSSHLTPSPRLIVWSLGRDTRAWNTFAAPVVGVLLMLIVGLSVKVVSDSQSLTPALHALMLTSGVVMSLLGVMIGWAWSRVALFGAELGAQELVVHGFLRTRRFDRNMITGVGAGAPSWRVSLAADLLRNEIAAVLQLRLLDGHVLTFPSSGANRSAVEQGAQLIREWAGLPDNEAGPVSPSRNARG